MKLSKNKISKLLKHKAQTRKQKNKNSSSSSSSSSSSNSKSIKHKNRTFRNKKRKQVNLRTKTLKKYGGGGYTSESTAQTGYQLFRQLMDNLKNSPTSVDILTKNGLMD